MFLKAVVVWSVGLLTAVPYGTYYLFFHAPRDQYALVITLVLFWVFGYWSVVGPLMGVVKVRQVMRTIEQAKSKEALLKALQSNEAHDVAIDLIARENQIPRFLAVRVYELLVRKLSAVS
jgi:hypothetical protein